MGGDERAREARERSRVLRGVRLPEAAAYFRFTLRGHDAGQCAVERAEVLPDGRAPPLGPEVVLPAPWSGAPAYTLAVYGVAIGWAGAIAAQAPVPLWAGSEGTASLPLWSMGEGEEALPIIVLRFAVRYGDDACSLNRCWQPDDTWTTEPWGLEHHPPQAERERMMAAWPLLEDVSDMLRRGGAPKGPRRWASQEQFLEAVLPIVKELRAAEGSAPAERVAQLLDDRHPRPLRTAGAVQTERDADNLARQLRRDVRALFDQTWEEFLDTHA